jgi:hypothetical protein
MDRWLHLICQELNYLIPPRSVRDHGRATDLIERNRHIDAAPFLWTFLVGTTQTDGSESAVHDLYKAFTGDKVAYSSIQQWITPNLAHLLIDLIGYVSVELGRTEASLGGRYGRFRDVFIPDATICTLSPEAVEDFPGFASSRLGLVLGMEAARMVQEGVASAEDIDTAMELGYNHPMGPLKLGDYNGWDVRVEVGEYLAEELGHDVYRPPQIVKKMVRAGDYGVKSGKGFYDWTED